MLLFSGTSNRPLAEEMATVIGQKLAPLKLDRFADGMHV
jgi:phosphoribosylpyrophosphate synthetase